jgi:hypothetical protein
VSFRPTRRHVVRHRGRFASPSTIAQQQRQQFSPEAIAGVNEQFAKEHELEQAIAEHRTIGLASAGAPYAVGWSELNRWADEGKIHVGNDPSGRPVVSPQEARKIAELARLRHQPPQHQPPPRHAFEQYEPNRAIRSVNPFDLGGG